MLIIVRTKISNRGQLPLAMILTFRLERIVKIISQPTVLHVPCTVLVPYRKDKVHIFLFENNLLILIFRSELQKIRKKTMEKMKENYSDTTKV